jgi:isoleucyl-tRNA synthetase
MFGCNKESITCTTTLHAYCCSYLCIHKYVHVLSINATVGLRVSMFICAGDGTGIVHQAPAFGEDDYRVCVAHGIVAKGEEVQHYSSYC